MSTLIVLVKRNCKLFFKDKGMFFSSLITPIILLVLYATFLGNVYKSSFTSNLPPDFIVSDKLINGCVGGQLFSSLIAVSCITVAFCSNLIMVQDKANGTIKDFTIAPVSKAKLAIAYYISTFINTLLVCIVAMGFCFIYIAFKGWFLSVTDILMLIIDMVLLIIFGTALSSIINHFLTSQGQMSAVGTIISAGYGFICGAYMPISQFSSGLQKVLMFLPGTYGTSLVRNDSMRGVFKQMANEQFPLEVIEGIKDSIDCNLYFFDTKVEIWTMYLVLILADIILVLVYILINILDKRKK